MSGNRSIFEEVATDGAASKPSGNLIQRGAGAPVPIIIWMMVLFALLMIMIVVGGLTRLTDSGLSITEWRPVTGAIPPLSEAAWLEEFEKYRQIPQYELIHQGMSLQEFQTIYWWEWGHRQLGRLMGLVWAVGFVWFWLRGMIPAGWTGRLLLLGALGGFQGAIGWWMVASGLGEGMIAVAPYRLAVHLGVAFIILGLIAWYIFMLRRPAADLMQARRVREVRLFSMSSGLMHLTFVQMLLGALVAGTHSGRAFPEWPMMAGQFFPPNAFNIEPIWRNFFENMGLVQFMHRMVAYFLFALGILVWLRSMKSPNRKTRIAFHWMFAALVAQVALGIVTALQAAHWDVAIAHQILAVVLWVLIIRGRFLAQYPAMQLVRTG